VIKRVVGEPRIVNVELEVVAVTAKEGETDKERVEGVDIGNSSENGDTALEDADTVLEDKDSAVGDADKAAEDADTALEDSETG
jgi:hypothetical protein